MHLILSMATNRIIPPAPEQLNPEEAPDNHLAEKELQERQERKLNAVLHAGAIAQIVIGAVVVLAVCYVAKLVLITLMVSILITFMLEPLVKLLERVRLPRSLGSIVAILLLLGMIYGASYFFYNRAVSFAHELPKYSDKIRGLLSHVRQQTSDIEKTAEQVMPPEKNGKKPIPVTVQSSPIAQNIGTVTEIALTLVFIPFLVYFMLSWQEHARTKSVQLFPQEHRTTAYVTLGQISLMMRSFIDGNLVIGLFMSIVSLVVFGALGLPYFYFLGFISGFLSLMPYLGIALAMIPPLAAGMGVLNDTRLLIVAATILVLHLFSMNVLYPKILGKRLQLNPLVVTVALLIWGFIWGAMGLILAVPIMGAIKIICDHVTSLRPIGEWMGD
ncbi:MAG TPA: AI-2E family transporter [Candidatus Angelobacter sp.]|nr:AI-2E family transporter [Candidatus Angelobacter sp.]